MLKNEFDNQFERMMRDKLNQKEFEFSESYWIDAKKTIKNDRGNKFKVIFISMASLLSIIGISAAIIVTVPKQMTSNSNKELINNESEIMLKPQQPDKYNKVTDETNDSKPLHQISITPDPEINLSNKDTKMPSQQLQQKQNQVAEAEDEQLVLKKPELINESHEPIVTDENRKILTKAKYPVSDGESNKTPEEQNAIRITEGEAKSNEPIIKYTTGDINLIYPLIFPPVNFNGILCDTCLHKKFIYSDYNNQAEKHVKKSFWAPELGITYYNANSTSIFGNTDMNAGFRYHLFIHKNIDINIGLFYSRLHQNLDDISYERVKYTFGKTVDKTIIQTRKLDYIEMPVNMSYAVFHNSHFITTGITLCYLINSNNAITKQNGKENISSTTYDNGYTYAVNKYDVQLNIGYMVFLKNDFILSANYGYGIIDISNDNVFHSSALNRNTGIRLNVAYKLLK